MLPKRALNIYPKTDENIRSVIRFYLDKYDVQIDHAIEILQENSLLSLNQIEFIFRKLSEAYVPIFKKHLSGQKITISNLIRYALDALTDSDVNGSRSRILITKEFRDFIKRTEVDLEYFEKNN